MAFESADYAELIDTPKGWEQSTLGGLLDTIIDYRGYTPPKAPNGIPCLTAANVKDGRIRLDGITCVSQETYERITTRGFPRAGDVLITTEAPVGEVAEFPGGRIYHITRRIMALRGNSERLHNRFLLYALLSPRTKALLRTRVRGSTAERILKEDVTRLPLALPPLREQFAIAAILGALDDKIELNRRMNETLETIARALFKSWFVDFEPVRAKMISRHPDFVDSPTARLFPSEIDRGTQSPTGWARRPLGQWVDGLSGGTPSKSNSSLWGGDIPWISPKVMTEIHADEADEHVTPAAIGNGTRIAPAGATLVMVRGMGLHKAVRVSQVRRDVTFNQDVKALVPRGIQSSLLLFALLDGQEELLGKVESSGHGTGKLPSEILFAHSIAMPPSDVQAELAKSFDLINERVACAREETRILATLRTILLPKLLSGELRIRDAERVVEVGA